MPVVSVSMPESLLTDLDEFIDEHGYSGRSEAVREGAREILYEFDDAAADPAVCVITTTFDHGSGAEATLSALRHEHQELVSSNLHSHAGGSCLELIVVEGSVEAISAYVAKIRRIDGVTAVEYSMLDGDQSLV